MADRSLCPGQQVTIWLPDGPRPRREDHVLSEKKTGQPGHSVVRAAKVTDGPVGKGTVFRSATKSMGRTAEMSIELTGFDRPARLASHTIMRHADMAGTLTFEPAPSGTRMR